MYIYSHKEKLPCPCCGSRLCDADEELAEIITIVPVTAIADQSSGFYLKCKVCNNIVSLQLPIGKCG